jgi:putative NIF3 family GTP cyclohydrolase 1 type 2
LGGKETNPAVGQAGELERVAEVKLETVVPAAKVAAVLGALRRNHPYEEPAFDLLQLVASPQGAGQGRIGTLKEIQRGAVIERIKQALTLPHLLIAGPTEGTITRAACCAGSCGDLLDDALKQGAQLYLTGEMRHHDALRAAQAGMTVVCTLHSNSERAALSRVAARLMNEAPSVQWLLSQADRDPFSVL